MMEVWEKRWRTADKSMELVVVSSARRRSPFSSSFTIPSPCCPFPQPLLNWNASLGLRVRLLAYTVYTKFWYLSLHCSDFFLRTLTIHTEYESSAISIPFLYASLESAPALLQPALFPIRSLALSCGP